MANRLVIRKPVTTTVALTKSDGANPVVSGSITAHISGLICGIDLKGGLAGVIAGGNFDLEIFQDKAMTLANRVVYYAAIDNFTISGQIEDASGNEILYDAFDENGKGKVIAYQNQDKESLLWYKFSSKTAAATFFIPLLFILNVPTIGE